MANLYMMCGVPGSGKSTYVEKYVKGDSKNIVISRDTIRYSLLDARGEKEYFKYENEVCMIMWNMINEGLRAGYNVYVDQTSLTKKSRKYLLDHVKGYDQVIAICVITPLDICLERNSKRKGRTCVPAGRIKEMYQSFVIPTEEEGFASIVKYYC